MALFVIAQFPTILVQTAEETVAVIQPGLPRSFAWLDLSSPCSRLLRRAHHSSVLIAQAYACLSGLHLALPPPQSMLRDEMVGLQWRSTPQLKENLSKYGSTSKFRDFVHGAACQMGHNSRQCLFWTTDAFIFPGRLFPLLLKVSFGCQNNKKYRSFLREVLMTYKYQDLMMFLNYRTSQIMAKNHARQCRSCQHTRENLLRLMSAVMIIAIESRLHMIQHNSLPGCAHTLLKTECKINDLAKWKML